VTFYFLSNYASSRNINQQKPKEDFGREEKKNRKI
jgi:hypothetical protein